MLLKAVMGERIWLTNERINHVAKVDVCLVFSNETWHCELVFTSVPDVHFVGIDADLDSASDETAWYGIAILLDGDDRIARDHAFMLGIDRKRPRRKIRQSGLLNEEVRLASSILLGNAFMQERNPLLARIELAGTAKSQSLIDIVFEMPVKRFAVAVFPWRSDIDPMGSNLKVFE